MTSARRVLVIAAAVLVVIELAVRAAAGALPDPQTWPTPESEHKVAQMKRLEDHPRVALFGDSMGDVGLDPSTIAGGDAYNASLSGTPIESVALWARSVVIPRLRPRVVVIGVGPAMVNANLAAAARSYANFKNNAEVKRAADAESALDRVERAVNSASYLFKYRKVLRDPASWHDQPSNGQRGQGSLLDPPLTSRGMSSTFLTTRYGFFLGRQTSRGQRRAVVQGDIFRNFAVSNRRVADLRRVAAPLRSQGRRVIIVNMPLAPEGVEFLGGAGMRDGVAAALKQAAAQSGATFLDAGVWDQSQFADPVHLNAEGASRLSALISPAVDA